MTIRRKYIVSVTIDVAAEETLRRAGGGNVSAGVRQCAREWALFHPLDGEKCQELDADGNAPLFTVPDDAPIFSKPRSASVDDLSDTVSAAALSDVYGDERDELDDLG